MRLAVALLVSCTFLPTVQAEITMPTPPKPPDLPVVEDMKNVSQTDEEDPAAVRFAQLDSIASEIAVLRVRLKELNAQAEEVEKTFPPESRRRQVFSQDEVDEKAYAIRRGLPVLPATSTFDVSFVVTPRGKISDLRIVSAPVTHVDAITAMIENWLYVPAILNNRRVSVRITSTLRVSDK